MQVYFSISSAHAYVVVICIERSENESVVIFPDQHLGFQVSLTIKVSYPLLYSEVYVVRCDSSNISEELKVSRTHPFLPLGVPVPVELSHSDLPGMFKPSFLSGARRPLAEDLLMTPMAVKVLDPLLPVFLTGAADASPLKPLVIDLIERPDHLAHWVCLVEPSVKVLLQNH